MNSKAVRGLRKKFIFVSMLSIAGVIFCLVVLLNVTISRLTRNEIRSLLEQSCDRLLESKDQESSTEGGWDSSTASWTDDSSAEQRWEETGGGLSILGIFDDQVSQDYFARVNNGISLFAVYLDENGTAQGVFPSYLDDRGMAVARRYADQIYQSKVEFGNIGVYYHLLRQTTDGYIVAFFDSSSQIYGMQRLLFASMVICLGVLIIVFWPVYYLSDRMIQPELRNIERQKQFITNASHELKTPLAVIRANTELVELMNGESEWTTSTLRQVDRMNGLIKNLVTIARAEEKADKSAMAEIDVSAAVKDTADTFAPVATQDGKELVREIEENVRMVADEATVRQLTSLLLDNAIKYCDDGGRVVCQLSRRGKGKGIRLSVSNSYAAGESIDYSRFFERFYREDSSHNTEKGGYGIGLSIAESIVSSYNGTISASWKNGMISFVCILV